VRSQPSARVLAAFGVAQSVPVPLGGGQGTSWRAGDLVLKPTEADADELEWQIGLHSQISHDGFRLARTRRAADGSVTFDGWSAAEYLSGSHRHRSWPDIIAAGDRLHLAMRDVMRPAFLDRRSGPWAAADRVAWNEIPAEEFRGVPYLPQLTSALRPAAGPSQVIHGDLTGNVLFDDRLPPAIIDLSPYWRPAPYAAAIVVADALVWEGADRQILHAVRHIDDFGQYLVRALIFRIVTDWILTRGGHGEAKGDLWADAVNLAGRLATAARNS